MNDINGLAAIQNLPKLLGRHMSLYVVATGAGAGIQDFLWKVPGASSFLQGASFPYSTQESAEFAMHKPDSFASLDFAIDLASAAYMRAIDLNDPTDEPVGLAVTANVASTREHRGDHRAHLVCMTRQRIQARTIILKKAVGDNARAIDGRLVDGAALHLLLATLDIGEPEPEDVVLTQKARDVFFEHPVFWPKGGRYDEDVLDPSWPLFAGAFNPPHEGHEAIANTLKGMVGAAEPIFTITADPPPGHKEPLNVQEMLRRAKMLRHRLVYFTEKDPLFIDKARKHPNTPLVIGADALLRMLDPKWGPDPREMFAEFKSLGTKFYVFGREIEGKFLSAQDAIAQVPLGFFELCRPIEGRWDISSTDRRRQAMGSDCTRSVEAAPTRSEVPAPPPLG